MFSKIVDVGPAAWLYTIAKPAWGDLVLWLADILWINQDESLDDAHRSPSTDVDTQSGYG